MRYYFFQTSQQLRDGIMKPTLRALPGQTFPDGTPVDTDMNVQSPKNAGSSPFGARLDYPDGTYFCSDHLEIRYKNNTPFYSVYEQLADGKDNIPNFHPVSEDANFQYKDIAHRNDEMNSRFVLFNANLYDPSMDDEEPAATTPLSSTTTMAFYTPVDENGNARPENPGWKERYQGQLQDEMQMFGRWLRTLFAEKKVELPVRIQMYLVEDIYEKLYRTGETLDTLASRTRFEAYMKKEGINYTDFGILKDGPLKKYLGWIAEEHDKRTACSAVERNTSSIEELNDALVMVGTARENITGMNTPAGKKERENLKKAFEAGWTLDDLLDPDNIKKADSTSTYMEALANGTIPLPQKYNVSGASYIESILADKKNRKPQDASGFHVEEDVWKHLIWAFSKKKNVLLTGPSGSGKTEIVKLLCEKTGTPLTIIQMGAITDPTEQLVGKMDIDSLTGGTKFDWAPFALAIQQPGVVLLDEINRIPRNGENLLFSCLDNTRCLCADGAKSQDQREIPVHQDCMFIATANIGDEFTGTKEIDAAMMTRFLSKIEMDYMKQETEIKILMKRQDITKEDATNIAFVANRIRVMASKGELQVSISTRETLTCAEMVHDGFPVLKAMEYTFLPLYDQGSGPQDKASERAQVRLVISQRFSNTAA